MTQSPSSHTPADRVPATSTDASAEISTPDQTAPRRAYHSPTLHNAGSISHLTQGLFKIAY